MIRQYPQDPFEDTQVLAGLTGVSRGQPTRSPGNPMQAGQHLIRDRPREWGRREKPRLRRG